jgi:hypothetical protein
MEQRLSPLDDLNLWMPQASVVTDDIVFPVTSWRTSFFDEAIYA